jgi:hypothetical protein
MLSLTRSAGARAWMRDSDVLRRFTLLPRVDGHRHGARLSPCRPNQGTFLNSHHQRAARAVPPARHLDYRVRPLANGKTAKAAPQLHRCRLRGAADVRCGHRHVHLLRQPYSNALTKSFPFSFFLQRFAICLSISAGGRFTPRWRRAPATVSGGLGGPVECFRRT